MPSHRPAFRLGALLVAASLLTACDSAEERADAYFNKGLELIAAGEVDKAILEFRNALQIDQDLVPPRLEFAKALMTKQDYQGAVGNFLQVIELDEDNIEARRNVAQILLGAGQVDDAMVHIDASLALDPQNAELRGLKATALYRSGEPQAAVEMANGLLSDDPASIPAALVLIGERLSVEDYATALSHAEKSLAQNPREIGLHLSKLQILERTGKTAEVGNQLREMRQLFPGNASIGTALVRWYTANDDLDGAETELRASVAAPSFADQAAEREASMALFRFLRQYRGDETARDELSKMTRRDTDRAFYLRTLSAFDYQLGNTNEAIERLKELLETDIEGLERNETKMTLADLYRRTGNTAGATRLFNEVLEDDPENVDGLRLRALNALDNDRPEEAISDLRAALNQDPESVELMTILATAHERNGSPGLALERLALAMRASDFAVPETLRYANFLTKEEQVSNALKVLNDGLSRRPQSSEIMSALARLQLREQNWQGALDMATLLEALGTDEAAQTASGIRIAAAAGQEDFDQSIGLLRDMWAEGGERTTAMENLVRTYVRTGESDKALEFLQDILDEDGLNMRAMLLMGAVRASRGETGFAEEMYRKVIANYPERENGYTALTALLQRLGRREEAAEVMEQGLANAPGSARLMLSQAARQELDGNFEAAIGIYETLYERTPSSELLANNLASLLSEHRNDGESLDRAFNIAKRLRNSEVPAYQDTYGWILYSRGEYERALVALRRAVEGLPDNALVNFHIGMTHKALGQGNDAKAYLERALELGEAAIGTFPQLDLAREALAELAQ